MNSQAYAMRPAADDALERVRATLEQADAATDLASLATIAGLSPTHLQRAFRRRYGVSPAEYARARRFHQLREVLRDGAAVTDAVYEAGFGSGSRVYEESDRRLGMTPASYRAGGAGASIRYTTTRTPLGRLLVATTAKGICAVTLGHDDRELETRLAEEFPSPSGNGSTRVARNGSTRSSPAWPTTSAGAIATPPPCHRWMSPPPPSSGAYGMRSRAFHVARH